MEELLSTAVGYLRLVVEAIGVAVVGFGVAATTYRYVLSLLGAREYTSNEIRLYLGRYLALGLEFQLGADILATAVAPSIDQVILLGAIAAIRTVLNYFLSLELERERRGHPGARARRHGRRRGRHRPRVGPPMGPCREVVSYLRVQTSSLTPRPMEGISLAEIFFYGVG